MPNLTDSVYIPFIRTKGERDIAEQVMEDVDLVRLSAEFITECELSDAWRLWIDPSFDGYDDIASRSWTSDTKQLRGWEKWIRKFPEYRAPLSRGKATQSQLTELSQAVLSHVAKYKPYAISVPQISYDLSSDSHKINEFLARAAGDWKLGHWKRGVFILPIVITDYEVYRTKTKGWGPKLRAIERAFEASHASAVWVVHAKFNDLSGVSSRDKEEFPKLIDFHERLRETLPQRTTVIAGPYWAINLILWARGLADTPAISCGSGYRYYPPSGFRPQPKNRIALPALRRWYSATPDLGKWVREAKQKFPPRSPVRVELEQIESQFATFLGNRGRRPSMLQTARFYEAWIQQLATTTDAGRALFLYQDFSAAFVTGAQIKDTLPKDGNLSVDARRPGAMAQQFMLQCLPR